MVTEVRILKTQDGYYLSIEKTKKIYNLGRDFSRFAGDIDDLIEELKDIFTSQKGD